MRYHPVSGLWDIFIPELPEGTLYKYEILDYSNNKLPLKSDPYAMYFEQPPGNASIVFTSRFDWSDHSFIREKQNHDVLAAPISMYEVHAMSWRRQSDGQPLPYRELNILRQSRRVYDLSRSKRLQGRFAALLCEPPRVARLAQQI